MIDQDILIEKTNKVQNHLKRIHDTLKRDNRVEILDIQDIIVLNLQRAVQSMIGMASYIISTDRLGIPKSLKDLFIILEQNNFINSEISNKMQKMVGFRNIPIHDYQAIDPKILQKIISDHLKDFEEFYSTIISKTLG